MGESAGDRQRLFELLLQEVAAGGSLERFAGSSELGAAFARELAPITVSSRPSVTWVGVNRQRVDLTVESAAGQTWRVVFGTPDGARVEWLSVYQRREYRPAVGGIVVVINGPSGAGKSCLMDALASASGTPWVRFDEPTFGVVDPEFLIWKDSADELHRGYLAGMAALAAAGNRVISSAAGLPQRWFREACGDVPTLYVGLDCPLEVLVAREDGREGRWGGLAEASVHVHEGWTYDLRLDSALQDPSTLARQVLEQLEPTV